MHANTHGKLFEFKLPRLYHEIYDVNFAFDDKLLTTACVFNGVQIV